MSRLLKLVQVEQPRYIGVGGNRWKEEIAEFEEECNVCRGSGWHWGKDTLEGRMKEDCPCCEGSGKRRATVEVRWEPGTK